MNNRDSRMVYNVYVCVGICFLIRATKTYWYGINCVYLLSQIFKINELHLMFLVVL